MGEDIRAAQFHSMWDLRQPDLPFPDPVLGTRALCSAKLRTAARPAGPVRHGQQIWALGGLARALAWNQAMPTAPQLHRPPALPPQPAPRPAGPSRATLA